MLNLHEVISNTPSLPKRFDAITQLYSVEESAWLEQHIEHLSHNQNDIDAIGLHATKLIEQVRAYEKKGIMVGVDAFLQQYSLDTQEGIVLMCLAEALLRIPDKHNVDALIEDKLLSAEWDKHLKNSDSLLVNASTWGLMLTGKIIQLDKDTPEKPSKLLGRLVNKLGEPVIRSAMYTAMKVMGKQFVLGTDIANAVNNSKSNRKTGYTHSYDMLGEAALCEKDVNHYFASYMQALEHIGKQQYDINEAPKPTLSIKLSALFQRYEVAQKSRVLEELYQRVLTLLERAKALDVAISIDAEEADRLELSLELFEKLYRSASLAGWDGLGLVVQAYSKRALAVLAWVNQLAQEGKRTIPIRLVKGAYWDSEIKWSQQRGLSNYPVYTRKAGTDVAYLSCAKYLLSRATEGNIYPQFATHNAHTVAAITYMAQDRDFEFQRLHGMGQELYDSLLLANPERKVRIYAPVGAHKELLPYLVRRLLENGANTSFVYKLVDPKCPISELITHPLDTLKKYSTLHNGNIVLPPQIFAPERENSAGVNLDVYVEQIPFMKEVQQYQNQSWTAHSIINGKEVTTHAVHTVTSPINAQQVGTASYASLAEVNEAFDIAKQGFKGWNSTSVNERAAKVVQLGKLIEANKHKLIALCAEEAGKSIQDGIDEVREAIDFCNYYAVNAEKLMAKPLQMPGPTGETNHLGLEGRGVFVCISPWNFPLAIFIGQIAAALVTGNTVVAKPAEQTNIIAFETIKLALEAGVPADAIQLVLGKGGEIGQALTEHKYVAGVCFTGSTATARRINVTLANKEGAIVPLIAETGGQNAMIVDSTSLPEQVVQDVIGSSFTSAGQRCSALRVLYLQEDISPRVFELLEGAMDELKLGDPRDLAIDVGPVIDANAQKQLEAHKQYLRDNATVLKELTLPQGCAKGSFVAPMAAQIDNINVLEKEHFGPILHIVTFKAGDIDNVISEINSTGFGLTLGVHSRNEGLCRKIAEEVAVGNVYINRNQIGAVVGVQPFGGHGLSGTGPKAGGPYYLQRFVTERTVSNNITAIGGNASLLILGDD